MKYRAVVITVLLLIFLATASPSFAGLRYFSDYMYITNHERTRFDEYIWFWMPDTLFGYVHSNDYISLGYGPFFQDW
ncbi:MAG: hypothetical protein P9L92_01760 [Candidatus Electryonea clarkiae]|nr:hypothetical protein [Candidatus Electryonea clarkiae]MDP8285108.1 hypothetical protein [Candidatus Electryonea clarkiae]